VFTGNSHCFLCVRARELEKDVGWIFRGNLDVIAAEFAAAEGSVIGRQVLQCLQYCVRYVFLNREMNLQNVFSTNGAIPYCSNIY
jgi:hypothetical protein